LLAPTNVLGNLLCLGAAFSDTALGYANAILGFVLDVCVADNVQYAVGSSYRLEQGSGPVFVDCEASPLLDDRALQRCLLRSISMCFPIAGRLCKRLLQLAEHAGTLALTAAARTARASGRARAKLYMMSERQTHVLGMWARLRGGLSWNTQLR